MRTEGPYRYMIIQPHLSRIQRQYFCLASCAALGIFFVVANAAGQDEDPFDDRKPARKHLGPAVAALSDEVAAALVRVQEQMVDRDWGSQGRPSVRGTFSELQGDKVSVRDSTGNYVTIPFADLSVSDQAAVIIIMASQQSLWAVQGKYLKSLEERLLAMQREAGEMQSKVATADQRAKEAERRLAAIAPGNAIAERDGVAQVTLKRFSLFGREFRGKTVRVTGCRFSEITDDVDSMPGVTIASDGLQSTINIAEKNKWIQVRFGDSTETLFFECYAAKADFAELFLTLSDGDMFDCEARVVELERTGGKPGLLITRVAVTEKAR